MKQPKQPPVSALYAINSRIMDWTSKQQESPETRPINISSAIKNATRVQNTPKPTKNPTTSSVTQKCVKCPKIMNSSEDMIKNSGKYYKSCSRCREKNRMSKARSDLNSAKRAAEAKKTLETKSAEELPLSKKAKLDPQSRSVEKIDAVVQTAIVREVTSKQPEQAAPTEQPQTSTPPGKTPSTRECSVCTEAFPVQDFPSLIACAHEPNVCQECFLGWLDQRMASTTWEQIQCPSRGCSSAISHDDVKIYAPADVFTRSVFMLTTHDYCILTTVPGSTNSPCAPSSAPTQTSCTVPPQAAHPARSTALVLPTTSSAATHAASASARIILRTYHSTTTKRAQRSMSVWKKNARKERRKNARDENRKKPARPR